MSNNGMKTRVFGPPLWFSLFIMASGYPVKLCHSNIEHLQTRDAIKSTFLGLQYTLPCSFCRESFKIFVKQLPIDNYLDSRENVMKWLYLVKDKVNQKLIKQEKECFDNLIKEYHTKGITPSASEIEEAKMSSFYTKPSPPFEKVVEFYEQFRGTCSKTAHRCV